MDQITTCAAPNVSKMDPSRWLDEHGDALFRYAVARVGDRAIAEDLVQDTLLAAMKAADTFGSESSERTWLTGILRHKVLDFLRAASREQRWRRGGTLTMGTDGDFDAQGQWVAPVIEWNTPEKSLTNAEFREVLNSCISQLPEKLRTPFALREFDDLPSDILVETLNLSSKNNLWVILSRARRQLRDCLSDRWFLER